MCRLANTTSAAGSAIRWCLALPVVLGLLMATAASSVRAQEPCRFLECGAPRSGEAAPADAVVSKPSPRVVFPPLTDNAVATEAAQAWNAVKDTTNTAMLDAFLKRYPTTFYADLARARLDELRQAAAKATPQAAPGLSDPTADATSGSERVVLYDEDPAQPKGAQYIGSVLWRAEPVKVTGMLTPQIAVRADITVPNRKLKMTLSFRKNFDSTLPATHTVELTFILPPDFAGGGISNVPGILMKSNEQARGTPLAGLAVKVTDGFFLVGLSRGETDLQRNLALLQERTWFDIPVVYSNQRRGIIAIEKGSSGDKAFREAFGAWAQEADASLTGSYLVQVSSQRSEADAQASYRALQSKFPNTLGSRNPVIKRTDLGDKGIYYRACVGPFAAAEDASQFCSSLKTEGGQCVVQRN